MHSTDHPRLTHLSPSNQSNHSPTKQVEVHVGLHLRFPPLSFLSPLCCLRFLSFFPTIVLPCFSPLLFPCSLLLCSSSPSFPPKQQRRDRSHAKRRKAQLPIPNHPFHVARIQQQDGECIAGAPTTTTDALVRPGWLQPTGGFNAGSNGWSNCVSRHQAA